jgi:hypothetical protein
MKEKSLTRRGFLRAGATVSAVGASGILNLPDLAAAAAAEPASPRHAFFLALGETLIPSSPESPGFKTLDAQGITAELVDQLANVADDQIELFNKTAAGPFGKPFVDLAPDDQAAYLRAILAGDAKLGDPAVVQKLQTLLRLARTRAMTLFYQNYPQHRVKRDAQGNPVRNPQESELVYNPNTPELETAWDITGFGGPLSSQQEQERRKVLGPLWKEYERRMHSSSS